MRDFADVLGDGRVSKAIADSGLKRLKIDQAGLEHQDREILRNIIEHYRGGPVGAETLAISIGESVDTLEDFHEPYLIQQGFLMRTPRGRTVTHRAYQHLGIALPNESEEESNEDQRFLF
jgi:Holliday junction DNA helicase RuvB